MAEETDVIEHLLDVEKEASEMILSARKEADEKIARARVEADMKFKAQYHEFVKELEAREKSSREKIDENHASVLEEYKERLSALPKNDAALGSALEKLLFV